LAGLLRLAGTRALISSFRRLAPLHFIVEVTMAYSFTERSASARVSRSGERASGALPAGRNDSYAAFPGGTAPEQRKNQGLQARSNHFPIVSHSGNARLSS
jgi:hypothetical protein